MCDKESVDFQKFATHMKVDDPGGLQVSCMSQSGYQSPDPWKVQKIDGHQLPVEQ